MKFQSKNAQNRSVTSNKFDFPIKHFKGTKFYLEECENTCDTLKMKKKRKAVAELNKESNLCKNEKMPRHDPLKLMSKLEQFSDVWNDCPNIENPETSFEVVPNHRNEIVLPKKSNNLDHSSKRPRETEVKNWTAANGSAMAHNCKGKINQEAKTRHFNSSENRGKIKIEGYKDNGYKIKEQVINSNNVSGKYDSKLADMKRKKAVEEQNQLHADQKSIIKKALSSTDGKQQVNKKIVFSDVEDTEEAETIANSEDNKKRKRLFEEDDSSEADFQLKVNRQFEGEKGQKLLELQSKFANDSRFTLDSRFHDSESENEKEEISPKNIDTAEERRRQLEILESIVKQPIRPLSETRKVSNKKYDGPVMVRFDPTRDDHQKYLLNNQNNEQDKEKLGEKKKKSKKESTSESNVAFKPEVSNEKVYAVKEDLKEVLQKENKTEFSLLKLFGSKEEDPIPQKGSSENVKKLKYPTKNPFKYDSSDSETEEKEESRGKEKDKPVKPSLPSWRTTFFFTDNDSRFKEAEEFLKGPEEPEGDQEFVEKRKMLKDFIRRKLKNNTRKKDPFKKKLGGVKKKIFHKKKGK